MQDYKDALKNFDFSKAVKGDWVFIMVNPQKRIMLWDKINKNYPESKEVTVESNGKIPYDYIKKLTDPWGNLFYDDGIDWSPTNEW